MPDSVQQHTVLDRRIIADTQSFSWKRFLMRWEWLLVVLLLVVNLINLKVTPNYLNINVFMNALRDFMDKAIVVAPMALIIMLGEIDISVAGTMVLSSVVMGMAYRAGVPLPAAIFIALAVGSLCGFLNGIILAKFKELSSMIVTLATSIIFRGIASILLESDSISFPVTGWFNQLSWGKLGPLPYSVLFVILEFIFFSYLLHVTPFGRRVRAIGTSDTVARFSGINTARLKVIIFTLTGLMAGFASLFLASKMGSTRSDVARGYELEIIAMVVLGGISTEGGKGNLPGTALAILIIGLLRYGLGMMNVSSQAIMIIVGTLLVFSVAIPNIRRFFLSSFNLLFIKIFRKRTLP